MLPDSRSYHRLSEAALDCFLTKLNYAAVLSTLRHDTRLFGISPTGPEWPVVIEQQHQYLSCLANVTKIDRKRLKMRDEME